MKKVLSLCLVAMMVICMSVTAFAAPNGFTKSPNGNTAPKVDQYTPKDEGCSADLVITPFGDISKLPPESQATFKLAYNTIINADDLAKLNSELEKQAKEKGIDSEDLAISDLFNISCNDGCDNHENHKSGGSVVLDIESSDKFVGIMYMNDEGDWQWVYDAIIENGKLKFTAVDTDAPYAIVVDNSKAGGIGDKDPGTGEGIFIYVVIALAAVCAAALLIIFVVLSKKKRKAN